MIQSSYLNQKASKVLEHDLCLLIYWPLIRELKDTQYMKKLTKYCSTSEASHTPQSCPNNDRNHTWKYKCSLFLSLLFPLPMQLKAIWVADIAWYTTALMWQIALHIWDDNVSQTPSCKDMQWLSVVGENIENTPQTRGAGLSLTPSPTRSCESGALLYLRTLSIASDNLLLRERISSSKGSTRERIISASSLACGKKNRWVFYMACQ